MSAPVLFVAADPRECAAWVAHWSEVRPLPLPVHWARAGRWRGRDMVAVANGAGWERAAAAVRAVEKPGAIYGAIYNIGFCGALDPALRVGDVCVATEVWKDAERFLAQTPAGASGIRGAVASIGRIAQTAGEKRSLREKGGLVVEMEAAGVARASQQLGVPFYCVRAVSDLAWEDFANDFNKVLMPDGRFHVGRLILGAMGSPVRRFGELLRLSRRTAFAAKILGEFLANCSY